MHHFYNKNLLTFLSLLFYILFIVWRNESSLYQINHFYNNSHIPDLLYFVKQNKDSFQTIFPNNFLSNYTFCRNFRNIIETHYYFNDFSFIQDFTYFFVKEKYLSNIFRDTTSHTIYKEIFDPLKTNSKKTLVDIIQLKPLIQTNMKTDIQLYLSQNLKNNFNIHTLFDKSHTLSKQLNELTHCQQLKHLSFAIADEFDQQPYNSKKSFLYFILLNLQKKNFHQYFFGFDTLKIIMSGRYPMNIYESLKIELISKINILLYLFKNSQNKMEFLMKQIIMETTFLIELIINYVYFFFWAYSILCICIVHMYKLFYKKYVT